MAHALPVIAPVTTGAFSADLTGGSGLVGLEGRVQAQGGRLTVHTAPGGGTTVHADPPLTGPGPR